MPEKVSVLGYDDTQTAEFSSPRLTSVHIPWNEVTLNGLHFLLNRCYNLTRPIKHKFAVSLTRRASIAMAPGSKTTAA